MNWKLIERVTAAAVFVWALILYISTVAPTASFWDSGEFIAIANRLQVSHPPGAPFYMLVGRLFSMFIPVEYISLSVNMVSVLASAFTIVLTHLIIVRIAREWINEEEWDSPTMRFSVLAGGVIGSLTFAATDSFWFNAVEAEVYALSMFFTALVVWLIMKWSEQSRLESGQLSSRRQQAFGLETNRYLIIIAYMFGLAIGVHLLNLLALFFIALIFYFTQLDKTEWDAKPEWGRIALTLGIASVVFLTIYPGLIQGMPAVFHEVNTTVGSTGSLVIFMLFLGAIGLGVYITQKRRMQVLNLVMLSLTVILIGYSTYALIFIRSASNPPIDENDPETVEAMISYLRREQYGATPLLKGSTYDSELQNIDFDNEVLFPRRYSNMPQHMQQYARYKSDFDYFVRYQIHHMYIRYFAWNFVGRASDVQDAPAISGIGFIDNWIAGPRWESDRYLQTPSERSSRNGYFGLPLLLGFFGLVFHFTRDWRRAFSVLILFLAAGIGIILYLNQPPMQPRERDYSYVASFFAFSLWIGIGATGLLQLTRQYLMMKGREKSSMLTLGVVAGLAFIAVPLWMTIENYHDHDRSGRYVAPEYAENMLASVADDAILITNGDNDTFPLWYLQEVEGVRQDVRVVNVSLLNTPWYIKQLKNQSSRDSEPLPFTISDDRVDDLEVQILQEPLQVELPVDKEWFANQTEVFEAQIDTSNLESPMRWTIPGRPLTQDFSLLYVSDQAIFNMLSTNARQGWKRPFYIAVTVSNDAQVNLQDFFQLEGQAMRVVPERHGDQLGRVHPDITPARLHNFKFTNLDDPDVYYDENIRRMVDNYRNIYVQTAQSIALDGEVEEAQELLDTMMTKIPFETIPGTMRSYALVSRAFQAIGDGENASLVMQKSEPVILDRLMHAGSNRELEEAAQFVQMLQFGYLDLRDYDSASAFSYRLADALEDSLYRQSPEEMKRRHELIHEQQSLLPPTQ